MFQLSFDNRTFQTIADFEEEGTGLPDFAKAAIDFCKDWLNGKNNFIQHTSGSTGTPKEIVITRAQMIASAKATQSFFRTDEQTKLLCCLDTNYIAGKMMLVRALVWNCPIEIVQPRSNPLLGTTTVPDFVALVPFQVEACLQDKPALDLLKKIKHLIIGGAPIPSALKNQLIKHEIQAYQTYGMTETVSHIAMAKISPGELRYEILPGVDFGLDKRNTLWLKSAASNHEVVQTNDLVELLGHNSFRWLGRVDFVINSGGVKLHPELLEAKAEQIIHTFFPNSAFFFFGKEDGKLGEKLCLLIEAKGVPLRVDDLLKGLREVLGRYEVPKNIFLVSQFVRTISGKINRSKTIEKS